MKIKDVKSCSFQNWYKDFKTITIKSIILPLPDGFASYILEDGIVLPKSCELPDNGANYSDDSDEEGTWDTSNEEVEAPWFNDFDEKIRVAIKCLGGKVFPKLNWSSPRDASWIGCNNSCCCTSLAEVYLLLKSSDFIVHDLTERFLQCEDYVSSDATNLENHGPFYLVLRKWVDIDTAGEFRCFVKDGILIGISQREYSLYFDHISVEKEEIIQDIVSFFKDYIQYKFPSPNYVFDIYRRKKSHVYLIDFNPFGKVTEALLFDWEELSSGSITTDDDGNPEFRYVADNNGVQPQLLSYHALPRDIVEISTGQDSFKLYDLLSLKIDEDSSEEESNGQNVYYGEAA